MKLPNSRINLHQDPWPRKEVEQRCNTSLEGALGWCSSFHPQETGTSSSNDLNPRDMLSKSKLPAAHLCISSNSKHRLIRQVTGDEWCYPSCVLSRHECSAVCQLAERVEGPVPSLFQRSCPGNFWDIPKSLRICQDDSPATGMWQFHHSFSHANPIRVWIEWKKSSAERVHKSLAEKHVQHSLRLCWHASLEVKEFARKILKRTDHTSLALHLALWMMWNLYHHYLQVQEFVVVGMFPEWGLTG